jgi:Uma2 family endonuclease
VATAKPRARLWTLDEYYRLADLGLFRNQHVEMIEGRIIQMPVQKNIHAISLGLSGDVLRVVFGPGHWVRLQMPLHLSRRSAPEPDLAAVIGTPRDYLTTDHPRTALLVVEISDTTLSYDRNRKASLYARAGIADYWIVNLVDRQLEIRRNPIPDPTARYRFRYADVTVLSPADQATPLAAPHARITVADLLP